MKLEFRGALCAVAMVTAAFAGAGADASVLVDKPGTASACGAGCWASGGSQDYAFRTWDDFSIADDARVTSVTWRGVAYDVDQDLPDLDVLSWNLGFFDDDGGVPGTQRYGVDVDDADVARTFLGTGSVGGRMVNYWEFAVNLPVAFFASAGGSYWFSPFANQPDYFPVFAWSGSVGGNTYQELLTDGSTFVRTNDRAFTLSGVVPEPQTWAMMILGFAAIGGSLRLRARTVGQPASR